MVIYGSKAGGDAHEDSDLDLLIVVKDEAADVKRLLRCLIRTRRGNFEHAAVRSMFGLHLVRTGEIERQSASALAQGPGDRLMADYNSVARFSNTDARHAYEQAVLFVARIRRYLIENGLTEDELGEEVGNG